MKPRARFFQLCLLLAGLFLPAVAEAQDAKADSVMELVYTYVRRENLSLDNVKADLYMRYLLETKRKGIVMRYFPGMFPLERGVNTYIGENHARFDYRVSGEMDWQNVAYYGTMPKITTLDARTLNSFRLSIYEPNLFSDRVLSPLHRRNRHYYRYAYKYDYTEDGEKRVHIQVYPRFHNTQLVSGTMEVAAHSGAVREFDFKFRYDFTHHSVTGHPGKEGVASLLPERLSLYSGTSILGNKVRWYYEGTMKYNFQPASIADSSAKGRKRFDRTSSFHLSTDTVSARNDKAYFDSIRPIPLSDSEAAVYKMAELPDTAASSPPRKWRRLITPSMEDLLFGNHRWNLGKGGKVRLPAIITPSMFQWSKSKGFVVQTRVGVDYTFRGGERVSLSPRAAYSFKQSRFYWQTPLSVVVSPSVDGAFNFEAGNSNYMYSSEQADDVRRRLEGITEYDSLIHVFDAFQFYYYRDTYFKGDFSISPVVGLNLSAGFRYHHRSLADWNRVSEISGMRRYINSFAPRIHVDWTPALYYYRLNGRRIPLHSDYPTFMFDYERSIRVGHCESRYERWETDIKYRKKLYALRSLYLRLGGGLYTSRGGSYFLDYDYFRDNNMPGNWEDEMSGQFQVLDSRWYNESQYYVRCSLAYDSPMLLFSRLKFLSRAIQKERLYCNLLSVHALTPYAEFGYGLSTHIVDMGAFVGVARNQANFGCKVVLRLFDDK